MPTRQKVLILCALLGLAYAAFAGYRQWQQHQRLVNERMQPPPEVLAFRQTINSPFAPGIDREERRRRMRVHGEKLWKTTTLDQKLEIADGYFPMLAERLRLTPEQVPPIRQIYLGTMRQMVGIWNGWTQANFDPSGPMVRSWLLAAQAQQAMLPHLNDEQKVLLQNMFTEARAENERREARRAAERNAATTSTSATTQTTAARP